MELAVTAIEKGNANAALDAAVAKQFAHAAMTGAAILKALD